MRRKDAMRACLAREQDRALHRQHSQIIEPVFAQIKSARGIRNFSRTGFEALRVGVEGNCRYAQVAQIPASPRRRVEGAARPDFGRLSEVKLRPLEYPSDSCATTRQSYSGDILSNGTTDREANTMTEHRSAKALEITDIML
jgi:hypothetical protein